MIISSNSESNQSLFNEILSKSVTSLNRIALNDTRDFLSYAGKNLENFIGEILSENCVGTDFENSIEVVSGQKFPDIVAKKYYGIEVKSTIQNHWKTTGNSVLETTRIDDVERIYMLFGKLAAPVEFRCRPYEECLSEVVLTHSPRYLVDMNLDDGKTIFDKIKIPYDTLRQKVNPIKPIVSYYKGLLKPGDELWWIDSESTNIIIRLWNNLDNYEKNMLRVKAMLLFPELFGSNISKFNRLAIWLSTKQGVICPNIRDIFTAGGKVDIELKNYLYKQVPAIFKRLHDSRLEFKNVLSVIPIEELQYYWGIPSIQSSVAYATWKELVAENSMKLVSKYSDLSDKILAE